MTRSETRDLRTQDVMISKDWYHVTAGVMASMLWDQVEDGHYGAESGATSHQEAEEQANGPTSAELATVSIRLEDTSCQPSGVQANEACREIAATSVGPGCPSSNAARVSLKCESLTVYSTACQSMASQPSEAGTPSDLLGAAANSHAGDNDGFMDAPDAANNTPSSHRVGQRQAEEPSSAGAPANDVCKDTPAPSSHPQLAACGLHVVRDYRASGTPAADCKAWSIPDVPKLGDAAGEHLKLGAIQRNMHGSLSKS